MNLTFFLPEIKEFIAVNKIDYEKILNKDILQQITRELPKNFKEKRIIGENDNHICELIRNDNIDEFISYIIRNQISVNSIIEESIYETNSLLISAKINLLEYASFFGSIQIFKYLFKNGAQLTNSVGVFAIHGRHPEIIQILKENIEIKSAWLIEAIKCHHNEIVDYFNQDEQFSIEFSDVFKSYNFLLFQKEYITQSNFPSFCKYDYISIAEFYITSTNIDVNNSDNEDHPPLEIAVINHNNEIVQLLLQCSNIDVNIRSFNDDGNTPLYSAISDENVEIVKILLKYKNIDVNKERIVKSNFIGVNNYFPFPKDYITPLEEAINLQNIEIVELLLKNKDIDVNKKGIRYNDIYSIDKKTPLYLAIELQNIEIIKLLLKHEKIDVNAESIKSHNYNDEKITPLYQAIKMENVKIVQLLLENKKINKKGPKNENLNLAIRIGNAKIVELLLKGKKTVNEKNKMVVEQLFINFGIDVQLEKIKPEITNILLNNII